jgi:acid phosphatase (class A)
MPQIKNAIAALLLFLFVGTGCAQDSKKKAAGYLVPGAAKEFLTVIPPSPHTGDVRHEYDHSIFRATRSLEGTPRWKLAQQDSTSSTNGLLQGFSCAMGLELTSQNAPRLAGLLTRLSADSGTVVGSLKGEYKRSRPFLSESGNICIARSPDLVDSYDYPSGHATIGWLAGLVLAEMAPDRTGPILTRARAYGESRVVCGVHTASAVDAGRTLASAILVALQSSQTYRDDFAAAKKEVEALRKSASQESSTCAAERSLTAASPYDSLPHASSTARTGKTQER